MSYNHFFNVSDPHTHISMMLNNFPSVKSHIRGKEQLNNLHNILTILIIS